jgi:hypothetical protein
VALLDFSALIELLDDSDVPRLFDDGMLSESIDRHDDESAPLSFASLNSISRENFDEYLPDAAGEFRILYVLYTDEDEDDAANLEVLAESSNRSD